MGEQDQSACQACPAGRYNLVPAGATSSHLIRRQAHDNTDEDCAMCLTGKWQDQPAAYGVNGEAATACKDCPPGRVSRSDRQGCDVCRAGKYSSAPPRAPPCDDCEAGLYNAVEGGDDSSDCQSCLLAAGKWSDEKGRSACKDCPTGWIPDPTSTGTACSTCPAGSNTENLPGQSACTACPVLKYLPGYMMGQGECLTCLSAQFVTGATECEGCKPGQYKGATTCIDCGTCHC
jgi:hypothetical protein